MLKKRSLVVLGKRTSIALEPAFWLEFDRIARSRDLSRSALLSEIARGCGSRPLASAVRVFTLANKLSTFTAAL